ncbi:MAG: RelA/SpoT family protein [Patescibacteria group bacterium]
MNVNDLLKTLEFSESEADLIKRAFIFSQKIHQHQKRKTNEPYFKHPFETALKISEWKLDANAISAALLHDAIEDTNTSLEEIKNKFGEEVMFLVDGVTKISKIKYHQQNSDDNLKKQKIERNRDLEQAENIRKMILALSQDIRVILIKLADRLHNMKTLAALPPQKQKRIALETSEIYSPLAYRLGMANLAGELEELSFPYLHLKEYKWLVDHIKTSYGEREKYLEKVKIIIEKILDENNIQPVKIDFRVKRYSSLYKKLFRFDMNLEQIYDLIAFRIIVKTIEECYATLGVIHQLWPPLPGKIKDYIAMPKPNGYHSLHTTVFCIDNKPTEFQIRTEAMHQEAENGIAAYWAYADAKNKKQYREQKAILANKDELRWVEQLRGWQKQFTDPQEFLRSLKIDFLKDRIFVITPQGEIIDLPLSATPVDFAYAIHTEIGNSCIGAKINNKIAPLDYQLQSGDLVEILVQKSKKPSQSWLEFVKTSIAKKQIKAASKDILQFKKQEKNTELKIIVLDRIGLLKDISAIISRNHLNIQSSHSEASGNFHVMKIRCETNDKEKIEKLILKLKEIKEIKEISYKLV